MYICKYVLIILLLVYCRYCSLHENGLFPPGEGGKEQTGKYNNIRNIPLASGIRYSTYEKALKEEAIPFLKEFNPELVIVSAGYGKLLYVKFVTSFPHILKIFY